MLKNIFFRAALLTLLGTGFSSCNKFLDLKPEDGITAEQFWQTKEDLQAGVVGIYHGINAPYGGRSPVEQFFLWGELRADFVAATPFTPRNETDVISNNILPTNAIANWQPIYRVINLCNTVLAFGPGVKEKDQSLTQEKLNNFLGEAYAIRALMYFYLVRTFGDVPLKLNATITDEDLAQIPKSTDEEVLEQIVKDLTIAEQYAVSSYGSVSHDKGRVTKWTVNAIQTDVYLWMNRFDDCIIAGEKIYNSGKFALVPGDDSWFGSLYVNGNSEESIFEMQYDLQPNNLNPFHFMFNVVNKRLGANPVIMDNFYTVNPDDESIKDIRGVDVAIRVSDGTIAKYLVNSPDQSGRHWIMYRYADVLLMLAEAYAHTGRGEDALDFIQEIRDRAHALPATFRTVNPTDTNALIDYILDERAREFAFEGKRWFDLLRNAKRDRIDILQKAALVSVPAISQESALSKLRDPNSLYLPIYFQEIQNNPSLVQNPFYK